MRRLLIIFVLLAAVFLSSCISRPPELTQMEIITKAADLSISLVPLSRETLIERHGTNKYYARNPFVDFPGQIPPRRIIMFEATFETTESTVFFTLKDISLRIGEKGGKATSVEYLRNLWYGYKDDRGWSRIMEATRNNMLPREFTVSPEEPASAYLVFANNYPKEGGDALMVLVVSTPGGDRGTIEIPMAFNISGMEPVKDDNTGIFAEEDS